MKFKEIRGRVSSTKVNDQSYLVLSTFSFDALLAQPGLIPLFKQDLLRAFELAKMASYKAPSLEELTKNYVFPKTIAEVRDLVQHIIGYAQPGADPLHWTIGVDTETNTKFPHRPKSRIIAISAAWDEGLATAIPLWHPQTPFDPVEAEPYIKHLWASSKKKVLHNYKFDYRMSVLKHGWDLDIS